MNPTPWLQVILPMVVVVSMLAAQAKPVYAAGEPPLPWAEPKSKSGTATATGLEKPRPPQAAPDQVAFSGQAPYQADGVLKDARGNPRPV